MSTNNTRSNHRYDIGNNMTYVLISMLVVIMFSLFGLFSYLEKKSRYKEALKSYYNSTERLLDTLNVNETDSVFSTRTGYDYLEAHEMIEKLYKNEE